MSALSGSFVSWSGGNRYGPLLSSLFLGSTCLPAKSEFLNRCYFSIFFTNTLSRWRFLAFLYKLIDFSISNILIPFYCQVEEEASDKDNKNCSSNGKQFCLFLSWIKCDNIVLKHIQPSPAQLITSTAGKEFRVISRVNHDMYADVVQIGALNESAHEASWIMQEFLTKSRRTRAERGLKVRYLHFS